MSDVLNEANFAKNVDSIFRVELESPRPVDLKLISVTPRVNEPHEQAGMERFSVVFSGPADVFLPQNTYRMVHPEMGEFELFLVPIAQVADGFRYEAVYNLFQKD